MDDARGAARKREIAVFDVEKARLATVPQCQHAVALRAILHPERAHRRIRRRHGGAKQGGKLPAHAFDGTAIEQVGAVDKHAAYCAALLRQGQAQVILGRAAVGAESFDPDAGHLERGRRGVLHDQHGLEQRRVAQRAFWPERIDHLLERHVLVCVRIERGGPDLLQQVSKRRLRIDLGAQHDRVDEKADQAFQLAAVAVGQRGPHADIVLSRPARQQQLIGSREHHEQGGAALLGERVQARYRRRRDREHDLSAAKTARRGTRPIGGQ